jgi:hypothetical protein
MPFESTEDTERDCFIGRPKIIKRTAKQKGGNYGIVNRTKAKKPGSAKLNINIRAMK